jgi:hypothetical protein
MTSTAAAPDREPLAGLVERVTYHNPDNGYCVLRVTVRGHRDLVTVLGHAASISAGEFIQASGKWEVHREHGQQFRAAFLKSAPPSSRASRDWGRQGSEPFRSIGGHWAPRVDFGRHPQSLDAPARKLPHRGRTPIKLTVPIILPWPLLPAKLTKSRRNFLIHRPHPTTPPLDPLHQQ